MIVLSQSSSSAVLFEGAPAFLTLHFALIAGGIVAALLILWFGARAASRRSAARRELEETGQVEYVGEESQVAAPIERVAGPLPSLSIPEPEPAPAVEPAAEAAPVAGPAAVEPEPAIDPAPAAVEPEPAPAAEPEAAPQPAAASTSDDLTRMKGVGPRLAERLNSAGITRFEQLAALSAEDVDALDTRLGDFRGRIHRDRWIEQATLLASGDIAAYEEKFGKL